MTALVNLLGYKSELRQDFQDVTLTKETMRSFAQILPLMSENYYSYRLYVKSSPLVKITGTSIGRLFLSMQTDSDST